MLRVTDVRWENSSPKTCEVSLDDIGFRAESVQELLDNLPPIFDVSTIHVAGTGSVYVSGVRDDGVEWRARISDHGSAATAKQQAYLLRKQLAKGA